MAGFGDSSVQRVDENTYFQEEKKVLDETKQRLKDKYIDLIIKSLRHDFQKTERQAATLAPQILKGTKIYSNAEDDTSEVNVHNLSDEFKQIVYDRSFLLISTPNDKDDMTFEDEEYCRELQYDNFVNKHVGLKENTDLNPWKRVTCYDYKDMKEEIKDFLLKSADATVAKIIINGHGSDKGGLVLKEGNVVKLGTIIRDVDDIMDLRKLTMAGLQVPNKVDLVLAHCYAHVREHVVTKNPDLSVICFTSTKMCKTTMTVDQHMVCDTLVIEDSNHQELNEYAEGDTDMPIPVKGLGAPPSDKLEETDTDDIDMDAE